MRFLSMVQVTELISPRGPPLGQLTRLIGMLGPCLTREARADEAASCRIMAAILKQGINTSLGANRGVGFDNPVIAASLLDFLSATELPWPLRSTGLSVSELRADASDGARHKRFPTQHHTKASLPPFTPLPALVAPRHPD